jgi:beta-glucosidase
MYLGEFNRREVLSALSLIAGGAIAQSRVAATQRAPSRTFPKGFMWGAATAAHQIEGNNVNSDLWVLENVQPSLFRTRSGDACDSYHRYADDIALLRSIGLDSYRFSIEWARIEPEKGIFSIAERDYYKRVIACCRKNAIRPTVTFHHNTSPRWFAAEGGWANPDAPHLFARYCDYAARAIAADIDLAYTINEPNSNQVIASMPRGDEKMAVMIKQGVAAMNGAAAKAVGSDRFSQLLFAPVDVVTPQLIEAHHQSFAAIKAARSNLPVGVPLSLFEYQGVGLNNKADTVRKEVVGDWLEAARRSGDFVGVQNYGRIMVDNEGPVKSASSAENAPFEPYAPSLGNTVRYVHEVTGKPIVVSENGMDTVDDEKRIRYIDAALTGLADVVADGVPVLGYFHWSLMDNFEWLQGYIPKYGLASVDQTTFKRTPKPSAFHLGKIAQNNRL